MVVMDVPRRSLEQRQEALRLANRTRLRRAELKAQVKAGTVLVTDVLVDPPEYVRTMKVYDLLHSMRQWGTWKVDRTLRVCDISPAKTVGGLTERQRRALVYAVWGERIDG